MFDKIKKIFKRGGTMEQEIKETVENVEETNIDNKENLETSETDVETQGETVEAKIEDTVVEEQDNVEETKEEEVVEETKDFDVQKEVKAIRDEFESKLVETTKAFEEKLNAKDEIIKEQTKKLEALEKRMPNDGVLKSLTEEETREPKDIKRSNVVSGFYGSNN